MSEVNDDWSAAERRELRQAEIRALSPQELRDEIERHASATWASQGRLAAHVKAHRKDFEAVYGHPFRPREVTALARSILTSSDWLFTALTVRGVEWYFVRLLKADSAMIAIVRGAHLRTVYLALRFSEWLQRHPEAIEVNSDVRLR